MELKIKKLRADAVLPEYATKGSAALDLRYHGDCDIIIPAGDAASIPTGIAIAAPEGTVAIVAARSGLAFKHGISLVNGIGVIDSDYRGEIKVGLKNNGKEPFCVVPGDRIAQLMLMPVYAADIIASDELSETERGEGGFGSTGTK